MRLRYGFGLALLLIAPAAEAAPATPEEAQRLTALFERYVGRPGGQGGAVTVVPEGESYTATLDLTRLFAFAKALKVDVTAGPLVARLTPQEDGRWRVMIDGLPPLGLAASGKTTSMSFEGYKLDGLFDPRIQTFGSATTEGRGSMTRSTGPKGASSVKLSETSRGTLAATDAGGGTVDATSSQSSKDIDYAIALEPDAGDAALSSQAFKAHGEGTSGALALTGLRVVALNDLWAFLVAHPSKEAIVGSQAELKTKLKAALPPAGAAKADVALTKVVVDTALGAFGAAGFSQRYEVNGPTSKDGVLSALKIGGLTLPGGLLPPWSTPVVPTDLDLTATFGPLRLQPALSAAIDGLDLSADKPLSDEQVAAIRESLGGSDMAVHLAPSTVASPAMTLRLEGDLRLTKPLPTGTATVAATGLDRTIDLIRAASSDDPTAAQAIAMMSAAKALAKADGPDSYVWRVEALPGRDITINGSSLASPAPPAGPAPGKPKHKKPAPQP